MKPITHIAILFLLICSPVNAQVSVEVQVNNSRSQVDRLRNQNLNHWSSSDAARRSRLSQFSPTISFVFESRVECEESSAPIIGCHVINNTKGTATSTDAFGNFRITADVNDNITFSALGYETRTIALTELMYGFGLIIRLKPTAYDLEELIVTPFRLNLPSISGFAPPLPNQGGINLLPVPVSPITALYNRFSVEGRQQRHFASILDESAEFMVIGEKFNGEIVSQITGLKDDELIRFMSFCDFSRDFLLNNSPETIRQAIRQKFAEFVEQDK